LTNLIRTFIINLIKYQHKTNDQEEYMC